MLRTVVLAIILGTICFCPAMAATIHVPANYSTIQAGINASRISGDTVLVDRGIYLERLNLNGHQVVLASRYLFTNDTVDIISTVIDANQEGNAIRIEHGEAGLTAVIGFTIRNASINGLSIYNNSSPRILHNIIENNINGLPDNPHGGGIDWSGGTILVQGNIVRNNSGGQGGAIWAQACAGSIDHNLIVGNISSGVGPGILLYENSGPVSIYNNTIAYNTSPNQPSKASLYIVFCDYECPIYNNIVAFNASGLGMANSVPMDHTYNDVYQNSERDYYGCDTNLTEIMVNPQFGGGAPFEYRLRTNSPCIDAGDPDAPNDPDGSRADMGALWPPIECSGYIAGSIVDDSLGLAVAGAIIRESNTAFLDTSDYSGHFILGPFLSRPDYGISITNRGFRDTTIDNINVTDHDTTYLGVIALREIHIPFIFISGDVNNDSDATPWADMVYAINYLHGSPHGPHMFDCSARNVPAAADANGSCVFNGLDVVFLRQYWIGAQESLLQCPSCPQATPDRLIMPSDPDPGIPDTIIIGNLDRSPIVSYPGGTVSIPVWIKNDECVPALNISLAVSDTFLDHWVEGVIQDPLSNWDECAFRTPEPDLPALGFTSQTLYGWEYLSEPPTPDLNTNGIYRQVAQFSFVVNSDAGLADDTTEIIPGLHHRMGPTAFCDSIGLIEWTPTIVGGRVAIVPYAPDIDLPITAIDDTVNEGFSAVFRILIANLGIADLSYTLACDSSWVTFQPGLQIVPASVVDTAAIEFDASHLAPGSYSTLIRLSSNDPDEGLINLPVTLIVNAFPYGVIEGTITDNWALPVARAIVSINSSGVADTTGRDGKFSIGPVAAGFYDILFTQPRHRDTTYSGVEVPPYDTVTLDMAMWALLPAAIHIPGDYTAIQVGVEISIPFDTVLVDPGTYMDSINFLGKDITLKSSAGPDSAIIEPLAIGVPIIRIANHESQSATVEGFTLRSSRNAPAIAIDSSSATLIGNIFVDNVSGYYGGAVECWWGGGVTITNNVFIDNSCPQRGGAVAALYLTLDASGNTFIDNSSGADGGAIYCHPLEAPSTIHHNLFYNNHCQGEGGAVNVSNIWYGSIYNNTIVGNSAALPENAGGLVVWNVFYVNIYNNIVANNSGVGLKGISNYQTPFTYNDVWGNTSDYSGIDPGDGSISLEPLFVNAPTSFDLSSHSPCIDAGDPDSPFDPDGSRADMGMFYFDQGNISCPYIPGDINNTGVTTGLDIVYGVSYLKGGNPPFVACNMCPQTAPFYAAGDVNGSCSFTGLDITFLIEYFKGGPELRYCPTCPPRLR